MLLYLDEQMVFGQRDHLFPCGIVLKCFSGGVILDLCMEEAFEHNNATSNDFIMFNFVGKEVVYILSQ